jgi:hypothetical protein
MAQKRATIIIAVLIVSAVSLAIATSGALSASFTNTNIPSTGKVTTVETSVNVGIFDNSACTLNLTSVDWGELRSGENATKTVWVKNVGDTDVTLSLSATGWTPSNSYQYMELTWDSNGKT